MTLRMSATLDADASGFNQQVAASAATLQALTNAVTKLDGSADKLAASLTRTQKETDESTKKKAAFAQAVGAVDARISALRAALASVGLGLFVNNIVNATVETQRFRTMLETAEGGAAKAAAKFAELNKLAQKLPDDFNQVLNGYLRLKNLGLDPTIESLQAYADLAAAQGKTSIQFIEAVADAATGEYERLKEFGFKASAAGDQVRITFGKTTDTIARNSSAIQDYFLQFSNANYSGLAEKLANQLEGSLSNLRGQVKLFLADIGENGVGQAVKRAADSFKVLAEDSDAAAEAIGQALGGAIDALTSALLFLIENAEATKAILAGLGVGLATKLVIDLGVALTAAARSMMALNVAMAANPIGVIAAGVGLATAAIFGLKAAIDAKAAADAAATPYMDLHIKKLQEQATAARELSGALDDAAQKEMALALRAVERDRKMVTAKLELARQRQSGGRSTLDLLTFGQDAVGGGPSIDNINGTKQEIAELERALARIDEELVAADLALNGFTVTVTRIKPKVEDLNASLFKAPDAYAAMSLSVAQLTEAYEALLTDGLDAFERVTKAQEIENEIRERAIKNYQAYKQEVIDGQRTIEEFMVIAEKEVLLEQGLAEDLELVKDRRAAATAAIAAARTPLQALNLENERLRKLVPDIAAALIAQAAAQGKVLDSTEAMIEAQKVANALLAEARQEYEEAALKADENLSANIAAFSRFADKVTGDFKEAFKDAFRETEGGFKRLMKSFEALFLDMLAELAFQALAQPILVNILQTVGTQGFGIPQNQVNQVLGVSGGSNAISAIGAASNLIPASVIDNFGARFGFANVGPDFVGPLPAGQSAGLTLSSALSGVAAAVGGYMLGSALVKPRKGPGNEIGGAIGGGAGYIAGGPIGAFIGSTIGSIIGGLFGARPSDRTEGVEMDIYQGTSAETFLPGKRSAENRKIADDFAKSAQSFIDGFEQVTGGRFARGDVGFTAGSRDGFTVRFGTAQQTFAEMEDAWAFFVQQATANLIELPENVRKAMDKLGPDAFVKDIEGAFAKLEFAANFDAMIEAMNRGSMDIAQAVEFQAAQAVQTMLAQVRAFKETTAELGLDTEAAAAATKNYVEQLLGLQDVSGPTSAFQMGLETIKGQFAALGPLLVEIGRSASDATEVYNTQRNRLIASRDAEFDRDIRDLSGLGFLNDLDDALARDAINRADALAGGLSLGKADQILRLKAQSIAASALSSAETMDDATRIVNQIKATFGNIPIIVEAADQALLNFQQGLAANTNTVVDLTGAMDGIMRMMLDINAVEISGLQERIKANQRILDQSRAIEKSLLAAITSLDLDARTSLLSPEARLVAMQSEFDRLRGVALSDDPEAAAAAAKQLESLGFDLIELARQNFGSTAQTLAISNQVKDVFREVSARAGRQADLAAAALQVEQSQLDVLIDIRNGLTGQGNSDLRNRAATVTDLDALRQLYMQAEAAGGSNFIGSAGYDNYVATANTIYGSLSDTQRLVSDLGFYQANLNGPHGQAYQSYIGTITARLRALGMPGFAAGGDHTATGPFGAWHISGERGIELSATGPARYWSAEQTMRMFGQAGEYSALGPKLDKLVAQNDELLRVSMAQLAENAQLVETNIAQAKLIAQQNAQIRDLLDRMPKKGGVAA